MSNAVCPARRLTEADAAQVCTLMQGNPLFYRYHPPQPTPESIRTDMTALPPGKAMEDKWFVGFYDGDCLIAVMDLILNYPAADTAFIGLFMTAHDRQGCGLDSRILRTAWPGCLPPGITGCGWRWMRAILRAWPSGPRTASSSPARSTPMIFPPISLWNAVFEAASPPALAGGLVLHFSFIAASSPPRSDRRTRQR